MSIGTHERRSNRLSLVLSVLLVLAGCASVPTKSTVIRTTFDIPADHSGFSNLLVISVAGDYDSRALFEDRLTAAFSDSNSRIAAFYTVVGRHPFLNRTALETAILSRKYDAVLFTRLKGQEREELVANRPVGQSFDLFGYDYPELNSAMPIEQASTITFVTELYTTDSRKKIWSIDTLSFNKATATDLITEQASTVAAQLMEDHILVP